MRIEKSECNYQVTECDLKHGEQITLDGELLIPISVIDKIRAEIVDLGQRTMNDNRASGIWACRDIIDKYKTESEK